MIYSKSNIGIKFTKGLKYLAIGATLTFTIHSVQAEKPAVIAHRGFWTAEGSAQNSIRSLAKADSIKCFGSEFDVRITADSVAVIHHDPVTIGGIDIEKSKAETVLKDRLKNGEYIPTLDQYLQEAKKYPDLRLICELKEHDNLPLESHGVDLIIEAVKKAGLQDRVDYITFSPTAFTQFIKRAPKYTPVYYLTGNYIPEQIKYMGGAGIDYHFSILKNHPDFITRSHELGLKVNAWTVNKPEDMIWCIENGVDFITTNDPETLQTIIKSKVTDQ